jgi:hypothetical protein
MSRENGGETMFDPELTKAQAIREMLKHKEADYFKARKDNRFDDADRIEQEYKDLLTEYKFIDPNAELSWEEMSLKAEAEDMQKEDVFKRKK